MLLVLHDVQQHSFYKQNEGKFSQMKIQQLKLIDIRNSDDLRGVLKDKIDNTCTSTCTCTHLSCCWN